MFRTTTSRRLIVRALAGAAALAVVPTVAASTPAQAAYCGITWGSLAKTNATMVRGPITNVRAGTHACYDRLVVDLRGTGRPGYDVRYVNNVHTEGQGALVPLRGGAKLQIVTRAPAYNSLGQSTYKPANTKDIVNVSGFPTFRQAAWAGSFEGQSTIGLGVRARLPFRAWTYTDTSGNSHLVVDVARYW
jgi:hypothetical protein